MEWFVWECLTKFNFCVALLVWKITQFPRSIPREVARVLASSFSSSISYVVGPDGEGIVSIPQERIRNFSVIAHIDHGKSTLSDCLLELTGNITTQEKQKKAQYTDTLKVRSKCLMTTL